MYQLSLGPRPEAFSFQLELDMLFRPSTSWNAEDTTIQAIEVSMTKWMDQRTADFELQWTNVRVDGETWRRDLPPVWSIWDGTRTKWVSTGVVAQLQSDRWYHLTLEGSIVGDQRYYRAFSVDGQSYTLGQTFPFQTPQDAAPNTTVHVQLDGSKNRGEYEVFVDRVNLRWAADVAPTATATPTAVARILSSAEVRGWCEGPCAEASFTESDAEAPNRIVVLQVDRSRNPACVALDLDRFVQFDATFNSAHGSAFLSARSEDPLNGELPLTRLAGVCDGTFRRLAGASQPVTPTVGPPLDRATVLGWCGATCGVGRYAEVPEGGSTIVIFTAANGCAAPATFVLPLGVRFQATSAAFPEGVSGRSTASNGIYTTRLEGVCAVTFRLLANPSGGT